MRLLAILLSISIFATGPVYAKCRSNMQSEQHRISKATAIFVAKIVSAKLVPAPHGGHNVMATYTLLETFKGEPSNTGSVVSYLGVPGILLAPGLTYLFFEYGSNNVGFCGGSRRLKFYNVPFENNNRKLLKRLEKLINELPNTAPNMTAVVPRI